MKTTHSVFGNMHGWCMFYLGEESVSACEQANINQFGIEGHAGGAPGLS